MIDLLNLIKVKCACAKNFNVAPSEIDRMRYWEYEYYVEEVKEYIKKEEEANDKDNPNNPKTSASDMMRKAQRNVPNFSNMKFPKI